MAERRSATQATDRLAFLLTLVPWLIDQGRVSVGATAAHFGVPVEEIRRAVELIAVSGVPGETRQYQHGDLFDIAWDDFEQHDVVQLTNLVAIDDAPRFSAREAAALIAGLQYLSALPEHADRAAVATLMSKLSRGASATPSQVAIGAGESSEVLDLVHRAVEGGVQLEFDYAGLRGQVERRRVDPLRVESVDADWYLRGWDHLREAVRTFRLDRIARPAVTDAPVEHRTADVALPDTLFEGSSDDVVVTLELDAAAAPLLADYTPTDAEPLPGDRVRLRLRVTRLATVARLVAGLPGDPEVVSPAAARDAARDWALDALRRAGTGPVGDAG